MQLKEGADIYTAEGKKVGALDRVVLDPHDKEVTGIVVRKGIFFREDKVVPMSLLENVTDQGRINLRPDAGDLEELPYFTETEYVPSGIHGSPSTDYRSVYWYPPATSSTWGAPSSVNQPVPEYLVETSHNIPEGTVALKPGSKVVSSDDEDVGDVEQVLTEPGSDRATHLIIARGLFQQNKKLVPSQWVSAVLEDRVLLAVGSDVIENLPAYDK